MTRPNSHHSRPKWSFKEAFSGDIDLTSGNLFGKMALYTFPIILLSLLQLLYSSADEIVVSYFGGGYASMNAIGSNSALINLVIGLFVGTSVGANVVVAKAFGEKDQAKAQKALESSMVSKRSFWRYYRRYWLFRRTLSTYRHANAISLS